MNEVERHSVTGYGRQDINYNDPEGEFVYYEDYAALKDSAMDYAYRWGKAQDDIKKAHMLHSMQKEEIASLKEQLTNAQEALKSAGIEADTVQAGVVELVSRMHRLSGDREKFAVQCAAAKIAVQYARAEGFECSLNTPDVDAYLNAVRAEGGPSLQANDLKALMRFNDTCDDGEGYDIGDEAMNRLVELGLVAKERGKMRVITSFGMWVIAREQREESGVLETQRDRDLAFQQKIAQLRAGNVGKDGSHE